MAVATVWPPPTPVLGQLGIALGPDMVESVRACVEDGRIKYLSIGMSLELRYSLIDNLREGRGVIIIPTESEKRPPNHLFRPKMAPRTRNQIIFVFATLWSHCIQFIIMDIYLNGPFFISH